MMYSSATWRLVYSDPMDGATNMAIDEAILSAVRDDLALPTLRLYAWSPPCLSLGRRQPVSDVDWMALKAAGFDLVRRPTGGKAILHTDELTYSVIVPQADPRATGNVVESYRRLSLGLVQGLTQLGVTGIVADRWASHRLEKPVCFEVPSDYEITVEGRKLVGSAQMRSQSIVLQHGALPLGGDIARICAYLTARPDPVAVRARATTIADVLKRSVPWGEAAQALAAGFAAALNITWKEGTLTGVEWERANRLRAERYAHPTWTKRC